MKGALDYKRDSVARGIVASAKARHDTGYETHPGQLGYETVVGYKKFGAGRLVRRTPDSGRTKTGRLPLHERRWWEED